VGPPQFRPIMPRLVTARKRHRAQISQRRRTVCDSPRYCLYKDLKLGRKRRKEGGQARGSYIYTRCGNARASGSGDDVGSSHGLCYRGIFLIRVVC
jgi:hypothetical protein